MENNNCVKRSYEESKKRNKLIHESKLAGVKIEDFDLWNSYQNNISIILLSWLSMFILIFILYLLK